MVITELRAFSDRALDMAKQNLMEHETVRPMFQILSLEGVDTVTPEDLPPVPDEELVKEAAVARVRELVQQRRAEAVVNIGQASMLQLNKSHPLAQGVLEGRYSMEEIERLGIARRREAVVVTLETPIYFRILMQHYERPEGEIVFGALQDRDSSEMNKKPEGAFFNFFDEQAAAGA